MSQRNGNRPRLIAAAAECSSRNRRTKHRARRRAILRGLEGGSRIRLQESPSARRAFRSSAPARAEEWDCSNSGAPGREEPRGIGPHFAVVPRASPQHGTRSSRNHRSSPGLAREPTPPTPAAPWLPSPTGGPDSRCDAGPCRPDKERRTGRRTVAAATPDERKAGGKKENDRLSKTEIYGLSRKLIHILSDFMVFAIMTRLGSTASIRHQSSSAAARPARWPPRMGRRRSRGCRAIRGCRVGATSEAPHR